MHRLFFVLPIAFAIVAVFLSRRQAPEAIPYNAGRNNTVLFLTTEASGLANVHIAACSALLENHPSLDIHYASFPRTQKKIKRIVGAAQAKNPAAGSIEWHELSVTDFSSAIKRKYADWSALIGAPGLAGFDKLMADYSTVVTPWSQDEHWTIFSELSAIIDKVDPAVIILDGVFTPAGDLVGNNNRRFVTLSPNTIVDLFGMEQPWGAAFWKYPAMASGFPYPMPWSVIPTNIILTVRQIWGILQDSKMAVMRKFLLGKGVKKPLNPGFIVEGVPSLLATLPEVNLPLDVIPEGTKFFGPCVIDTAPAAEQDPEMASWLKLAPTMLINLGSLVQYTEERTKALVDALVMLLDSADNQVLWKYRKGGNFSDSIFDPVQPYIDNGRLRIETWLNVDPISLLETGDIVLSVHHGGAGCYHEAIYSGIPQVILPLWFDLYGVAQTAEYVGIGIWPGKKTAPNWEADTLAKGFLEALQGKNSAAMRQKSKELSVKAKGYGGRKAVAAEIARMAGAV